MPGEVRSWRLGSAATAEGVGESRPPTGFHAVKCHGAVVTTSNSSSKILDAAGKWSARVAGPLPDLLGTGGCSWSYFIDGFSVTIFLRRIVLHGLPKWCRRTSSMTTADVPARLRIAAAGRRPVFCSPGF
jgi:hypothetical protein